MVETKFCWRISFNCRIVKSWIDSIDDNSLRVTRLKFDATEADWMITSPVGSIDCVEAPLINDDGDA